VRATVIDFTASNPPEVLEDQGPVSISGWATYNGPSSPPPNYTVDGVSNPGLFSTAPRVSSEGILSYTSKKDEHGSSQFRVTARAGNNSSDAKTFTINVLPVNDQPSFEASNPPPIQQGAGMQTIQNWAKFNPGAPNESDQTATYIISSIENPDMFQQAPTISPNGTLTFHVKDNLFGTSTFGVQVRDNGGTANGGVDLSTVKIFIITVNEVKPTNTPPYFTSQPVLSVLEDRAYEYKITVDDAETHPNDLSIRASTLPSWLTFSIGSNGTAVLKGTPTNDHVGFHAVVLVVSDGNLSTEQRFTIEVINVNNKPFFVSNPNTGAQIDKPYTYQIIVDDIDKGDVLTIEVVRKPSWLNFTSTGERTAVLSGTPSEDHTGAHHIILRVRDKEGATTDQEFYLIINKQPVVTSFNIEVDEDVVFAFSANIFRSNFRDVNNLGLSAIRIIEIPVNGKLELDNQVIGRNREISVNDLGRLRYVPNLDYFGSDQFSWMGSNGIEYSSNFAIVAIAIAPVNDAPRLTNMESSSLAFVPGKDEPKNITNSLEVYEPDGDKILGAQIIFNPRSFVPEEDFLIFEPFDNIIGTYSRAAGILTLMGEASDEVYQQAIRSVKYFNISNNPSYEIREFSIYVDDGQESSNFVKRNIQLIDGLVELIIPSAFTPNGDGVNDVWRIQNLHLYPESIVKVFNRSGQVVYMSTYDDNTWDGRFNAKELPQGSYYYIIDLRMFNKVYSGTVTILK
jgi:large repetitive protein